MAWRLSKIWRSGGWADLRYSVIDRSHVQRDRASVVHRRSKTRSTMFRSIGHLHEILNKAIHPRLLFRIAHARHLVYDGAERRDEIVHQLGILDAGITRSQIRLDQRNCFDRLAAGQECANDGHLGWRFLENARTGKLLRHG